MDFKPQIQLGNRMKASAAALLAAGLLVTSVAPSSAAGTWPQQHDFAGTRAHVSPHASSFHRHFWRGSQLAQPRTEMMALADEPEPMDEAVSYCASRFRSYDPMTGTYLGYDGDEHSCP